MNEPGLGAWRVARAASFTTVALALSCAAHVLGGGAPPRLLQVLVLAVGTGGVALLLTGRRCGTLSIGLALAADQAVIHLVLMGSSVPTSCGAVAGGEGMAHEAMAHQAMAHQAMACSAGATSGVSAAMTMPSPGAAMLLWHVLATAVIAAGLAYGERALWQLAEWIYPSPPRRVSLVLPMMVKSWLQSRLPSVSSQVWLRSVSPRGPPEAASATAC